MIIETTRDPTLALPDKPPSLSSEHKRLTAIMRYLAIWHRWYWATVPLLAIVAYIPVLRIGFLADDFFQLFEGLERGIDPLRPFSEYDGGFLRPVGVYLTFQVGWALFGNNPFPYHLVALLAHATTSLILGLWLATATRKPGLGWLAGSLFAVFPLHIEAVGWVGAQFDAFAALFGVAALWCFTLWWSDQTAHKRRRWALFAGALFLFSLAVFTKESVFTFVPMLALSAWFVRPPTGWQEWRKLLLVSAIFFIPITLNVGFRAIKIGSIGGYYGVLPDYGQIIWDALATYVRLLLAPLNIAIFGKAWVQIIGIVTTVALLVGLTLFGRPQRRLLLVAGVWMALTIVPVLNLAWGSDELQQRILPVMLLNVPEGTDNLQQNRYLYLVSAGYLVGISTLLYSALRAARKLKPLLAGLMAMVLLISAGICWAQLNPWHTATVQVNELVSHLLRAIPYQFRPSIMTWYSDHVPFKYKGVPLLLSGLGISRVFAGGDYPRVERVADATQAPLADDPGDAFALRFRFDERTERFGLDYIAGITRESAPPEVKASVSLMVWDFRDCDGATLSDWLVEGDTARCEAGKGLMLAGAGADPKLVGRPIDLAADFRRAQFIRIRVSARYNVVVDEPRPVSEWFWKWPGVDFSGERFYTLPIKKVGTPHVYWTYIPVQQVAELPIELRFDPINSQTPSELHWIAVDLVE